jgi:hypothetical protein
MPDETPSAAQPAPAETPTPAQRPAAPAALAPVAPAAPPPPLAVQLLDQLSDLAGVGAATYLAAIGRVTGLEALIAIGAILGVQTGLRRALGGKGGERGTGSGTGGGGGLATAGVAAMLAAGHQAGHAAAVLAVGALAARRALLALGVSAALTGCPLPPPDGCTPRDTRCAPDGVPEVCSSTQRWTRGAPSEPCPSAATCCRTRSVLGGLLHACVPSSACVPEGEVSR